MILLRLNIHCVIKMISVLFYTIEFQRVVTNCDFDKPIVIRKSEIEFVWSDDDEGLRVVAGVAVRLTPSGKQTGSQRPEIRTLLIRIASLGNAKAFELPWKKENKKSC
jgi:hypothetical protein